jgi:AraC family transcriptional regulator
VSLETTLTRVPLAASLEAEPPVSLLSSGERWKALRLEHLRAPASELGEGYLSAHLVALLLSGPQTLQLKPAGAGWTSYPLESGSVQVVPAYFVHSARWSAPIEWIGLLVDAAFLQGVAGNVAGGGPVDLRACFGVDDALIRQLVLALRDEVRDGGRGGNAYADQLGGAVAARLARDYAVHEARLPRRGGLAAEKLRSVVRYIHDHLEGDLPLPGLADLLHMNVHSFVRSFRRSTGLPPHQYVLRQRIARAKALLDQTPLSLAEVALRSGFANQSNFTTAFRRIARLTPGAYRQAGQDFAMPPRTRKT